MGHVGLADVIGRPSPIFVWDIVQQRILREVQGFAGSVISIDTSVDSRFACASGENAIVQVFEIVSGQIVFSQRFEESVAFCMFASLTKFVRVSADRLSSFTFEFDLSVMKFVVESETCTFSHRRKVLGTQSLLLLDSDRLLMASSTGDILLYDLRKVPLLVASFKIEDAVLPVSALFNINKEEGLIGVVVGDCRVLAVRFTEKYPSILTKICDTKVPIDFCHFAHDRYWVQMRNGERLIFENGNAGDAKKN